MKEKPLYKKWLERARSNLERARSGKVSRHVLYEDICFDCQQAVEKSLKALMVKQNIAFEWTHNIGILIHALEENGFQIPEKVKKASMLSTYAVRTRYPGTDFPIKKSEYEEAFKSAEAVFIWVHNEIL